MQGDQHPKRAALRSARAEAIERLTHAFTHDELGLDEFEQRLNRAYQIEGPAEFEPLLADLSEQSRGVVLDAEVVPAANSALLPVSRAPRTVAILGSVQRRGQGAARASGALAVLGSVVIDLRDVALPAGVTTLKLSAVLGSIEIIVPPQLAVESEGSGILGSFEGMQRVPREPDPDLPVLRVEGRALLGSIEVRTELPESRQPLALRRR